MSELKRMIMDALEGRAILGLDIKLGDLIRLCYTPEHAPSSRQVRRAIEDLRAAGKPIGSSARRGYFIIRTRQDWEDAVAEFRAKAMACLKMKAQLERIGTDLFTDQQKLNFGDAADEAKGSGHGNHLGTPA